MATNNPPDQSEACGVVNYYGKVTRPLFDLNDLLTWTEPICPTSSDGDGATPCSLVPDDKRYCYQIPKRRPRASQIVDTNRPLTLVCHDMKGGYLDDRHNNGHTDYHAYRFYHWSLVDIFVYFSHHLVSIPPIGWTTAAHRNGVKIFGTFIIEYFPPDGEHEEADRGILPADPKDMTIMELLRDEERIEAVTSALARVSAYYQIDGWLVNMETPIPVEKIPLMELLLRRLSVKMKITRELAENDIAVIWYDAVTADTGELRWQNELNIRNGRFFAAADAIFLNYTWKPENLERSRDFLFSGAVDQNSSSDSAVSDIENIATTHPRLNRIFAGIDVFGRGCLGGGGFFSNVAMSEIHKAHLSVAIFAPGWTFEMCGAENFAANEHTFWEKMLPYLEERCLTQLPVRSTFCQGFGDRTWAGGVEVDPNPWFDLRRQQLQPCFHSDKVSVYPKDAWFGGASLKVLASIHQFDLFRLAIRLDRTRYYFSLVYKISHDRLKIASTVLLEGGVSGKTYQLDLDPDDLEIPASYGQLIKSIDVHRETLQVGWKRDTFKVELFPNTFALSITGIKCAIGIAGDDAADGEIIDGAYVLLGEIKLTAE